MNDNFKTTCSEDEVRRLETIFGKRFKITCKLCDFCGTQLPVEHVAKQCPQCPECPTLYDVCDKCEGPNTKICHRPHDGKEARERHFADLQSKFLKEFEGLPKKQIMTLYGESYRRRMWMDCDESDDEDFDPSIYPDVPLSHTIARDNGFTRVAEFIESGGLVIIKCVGKGQFKLELSS